MKRGELSFDHSLTHTYSRPVFDSQRKAPGYTFQSADEPKPRSLLRGGGYQQRVHLLTKDGKPEVLPVHARSISELAAIVNTIEEVAHAEKAKDALKARKETVGEAWELAASTYREGIARLARRGIRLPR